ncbi:MAG TPA: glycosyltransferase family 39 protein [Puia sp.]|nr:glycosyltransferase family 39 protein [Puia sp.]
MLLKRFPPTLLIGVAAVILFIPFLGMVHLFDWDEINFAEASREMLVTHNYSIPQINFQPFWEKPPLFFWLQVLSMKLWGVNEFSSRFPNAICGICTLLVLYRFGKKLFDDQFGLIWALVYAGSLLPHFYFKSGIIDPWFNLFIFLAVYQFALYSNAEGLRLRKHILLAGLFTGLAVMTKGPVAILVLGLTYGVYMIATRFRQFIRPSDFLLFLLIAAGVGGIWFLALWSQGQQHIIWDFIVYQVRLFRTEDADHGGPFFYHFVILLIGCFPATALGILSMRWQKGQKTFPVQFQRWMLILFWVVLILFSIVKTKIVHYSSLCYFPLSFLAAHTFYRLVKGQMKLPGWSKWLEMITGLILAIALCGITFIDRLKPWLLEPGRIQDEFAKGNLQANVSWSGFEIIPGLILLCGVIFFGLYTRKHIRWSLFVLFICSLVGTNLATAMIAPKVEPYSQGAAIAFYIKKQHEKAVIEPLGFKSYAQLFYALRPPALGGIKEEAVFTDAVPAGVQAYCVVKIQNAKTYEQRFPQLEKLYEKNGFVFYVIRRK